MSEIANSTAVWAIA